MSVAISTLTLNRLRGDLGYDFAGMLRFQMITRLRFEIVAIVICDLRI